MTIELRKYQSDLVKSVRSECANGFKNILMVLPTGGGKTFICADIAQRAVNKGHQVLCLMHRRQLVEQMADRFSDYGLESGIIMAGTDTNLQARIQIGTIQTYHRRIKIDSDGYHPFFVNASIVIVDEAHRSLSKTYQDVLKLYQDKITIGVTATPCLSSGIGMGRYYDALVDEIGVGELIKQGHLVPARYYAPTKPDLAKVRTIAGDYEKKSLGKIMNKKKLIGSVFENWAHIAGGKQTIVFAVNVKHSIALRDEFQKNGVAAEHLDAHSNEEERADVLRRLFDGDVQVVVNVGLYTEGFDYPGAEAIVIARPTKSMGLYRQMAGRGLRPFKGKGECVIIDHGGCIDRLGFIEDDVSWTLNGKEIAWKKKVVRKKEKTPMTCDACSNVFVGKRCPMCGTEIENYGKKVAEIEARLVEIKGKKKTYTMDEKRKWYAMLDHERRLRGYAQGWLAHKYREKFNVWPKGMDNVTPCEPNQEVSNWIKYQRIKWAKSRKTAA